MRVFVTGAGGQLGHDVVIQLSSRGHVVTGSDRRGKCDVQLDITDSDQVQRVITETSADAVIHCAAWTAVDAAEDDPALARQINRDGTQNIASVCKLLNCKMVYISTDYVFDGSGEAPWTVDNCPTLPISIYGQTKLEGELAVKATLDKYFIIRTSWVFGCYGKNFSDTILRLAERQRNITVVADQVGTPTYTVDLARLLADMIETEQYGCYHVTNECGFVSWYDFARELVQQSGLPAVILPVSTAEYGLNKAKRPKNSRLDTSKLASCGFASLPPWQDAVKRYLRQRKESGDL